MNYDESLLFIQFGFNTRMQDKKLSNWALINSILPLCLALRRILLIECSDLDVSIWLHCSLVANYNLWVTIINWELRLASSAQFAGICPITESKPMIEGASQLKKSTCCATCSEACHRMDHLNDRTNNRSIRMRREFLCSAQIGVILFHQMIPRVCSFIAAFNWNVFIDVFSGNQKQDQTKRALHSEWRGDLHNLLRNSSNKVGLRRRLARKFVVIDFHPQQAGKWERKNIHLLNRRADIISHHLYSSQLITTIIIIRFCCEFESSQEQVDQTAKPYEADRGLQGGGEVRPAERPVELISISILFVVVPGRGKLFSSCEQIELLPNYSRLVSLRPSTRPASVWETNCKLVFLLVYRWTTLSLVLNIPLPSHLFALFLWSNLCLRNKLPFRRSLLLSYKTNSLIPLAK